MIQWESDLDATVVKGKAEGKKILLLGGDTGCAVTMGMKDKCELTIPPLKTLIEKYFIPWFSDRAGKSIYLAAWSYYAKGLVSKFPLPVICVIDPNDSGHYLDRTTGKQDPQVLYDRLVKYTSEKPVEQPVVADKKKTLLDSLVKAIGEMDLDQLKRAKIALDQIKSAPPVVPQPPVPSPVPPTVISGTIGSMIRNLTTTVPVMPTPYLVVLKPGYLQARLYDVNRIIAERIAKKYAGRANLMLEIEQPCPAPGQKFADLIHTDAGDREDIRFYRRGTVTVQQMWTEEEVWTDRELTASFDADRNRDLCLMLLKVFPEGLCAVNTKIKALIGPNVDRILGDTSPTWHHEFHLDFVTGPTINPDVKLTSL